VVISGISDEEIRKEVLGCTDLDRRSLNETISLIENKEMAVRAMSSYVSPHAEGSSMSAVHQKEKRQAETSKTVERKF